MSNEPRIMIFPKGTFHKVLNHFVSGQFDCNCIHYRCKTTLVDLMLAQRLKALEEMAKENLVFSRGYSCSYHNNGIKGASKFSQHMKGVAVDVTHKQPLKIARLAKELGFTGIIIYDWGVHLDMREGEYFKDARS